LSFLSLRDRCRAVTQDLGAHRGVAANLPSGSNW
jgi:hypothetical protein